MRELLTDRESAKILGIKINQLYDAVDFFDRYDDDPWDLVEGEHFEFIQSTGDYQERRFTEEGIEAIAKYLEGDKEVSSPELWKCSLTANASVSRCLFHEELPKS